MFIDDGWGDFKQETKEEVVQNAITIGNKRSYLELEDYLRYWKKDIDRKNVSNKVGYLRDAARKGWKPFRAPVDFKPPYEEEEIA